MLFVFFSNTVSTKSVTIIFDEETIIDSTSDLLISSPL